jgi:hypothetical protein
MGELPDQPFMRAAANVSREPIVTDAARYINGRFIPFLGHIHYQASAFADRILQNGLALPSASTVAFAIFKHQFIV